MGKKSRRPQTTTPTAPDTSVMTGSRSEARRPQRRSAMGGTDGRPISAHARTLAVGVIAALGVGLLGYMALSDATAAAYTCDSLLEAPADQTLPPLPGETDERLGFIVEDEGRTHSEGPTRYAACPPTSGDHRAAGALSRDFYGPGSGQAPNDWIHNLEHGYAVIAYAGEPDRATLAQLRDIMDTVAPTEVADACGLPNKVVVVRFDAMSEPFAVLAWDRALLLSDFDADRILAAAEEFQDGPQAPERAC